MVLLLVLLLVVLLVWLAVVVLIVLVMLLLLLPVGLIILPFVAIATVILIVVIACVRCRVIILGVLECVGIWLLGGWFSLECRLLSWSLGLRLSSATVSIDQVCCVLVGVVEVIINFVHHIIDRLVLLHMHFHAVHLVHLRHIVLPLRRNKIVV